MLGLVPSICRPRSKMSGARPRMT